MGPFKYLPLMECTHKIYSMKHLVNGVISINDMEYFLKDDLGYLEGDYGVSFPNKYIWVQANNLDDGAFFLSVATIPYCKLKFTGLIASLIIGQKEYRFATYNLAKILINTKDHISIKKRKFVLDVYMKDSDKLVLAAPKNGDMTRLVHESMEAEIEILLTENGKTIFKPGVEVIISGAEREEGFEVFRIRPKNRPRENRPEINCSNGCNNI